MCLFEICVRFAVLILSKEKKGACIDGDMHLINIANIFYVPRDMLGARNIWVEVLVKPCPPTISFLVEKAVW